MKILILLCLAIITIQTFAQLNYASIRRQSLQPLTIDTLQEKVFIYEVATAFIYFRQQDIIDYLAQRSIQDAINKIIHKPLLDTLNSNIQVIRIKDVWYSFGDIARDSIVKAEAIPPNAMDINALFHYIGADLVLQGKFMIYSKKDRQLIKKGLLAKRKKGLFGSRYLVFLLPKGIRFYYIVVALGE